MMYLCKTFITQNDCYKAGRTIKPKGIMVHSTATPGVMAHKWFSRWNRSNHSVAVHAFLDDEVVCQHLPWNHRAWHCGSSGNNTHISFEMCEPSDWKTNRAYFLACYQNAVELAAYLCHQYGLNETHILSHKEGHAKGIASNHGDPDHWWGLFGYTMNTFRSDVKKRLASGGITVVNTDPNSILEEGSKGTAVTALQKRLNHTKIALALAFNTLEENGTFDKKTKEAVRAFQSARNLVPDGIVGPVTHNALWVSYGDVDNDGAVKAKDALTVLRSIAGKQTLNASAAKAADLNGDGKITADDASLILRRVVNKQ